MKRLAILVCFLALTLLVAPPASATINTLHDQNSTVFIDDSSQAGAFGWTVDGFNALFQQWFWYRVDNDATGQHSIDTLPLLSSAVAANNTVLSLEYGSRTGLEFHINYLLTGGNTGSNTSDIAETIAIHNNGGTAMDMHFFQYSDFDLNRPSLSDRVTIRPDLSGVRQVPVEPCGNCPVLSETIIGPSANEAEANFFANTRNSLNSGAPYTLNNVLSAGPGDVTWAFEWDTTIAAGGSFIISKDKRLAPVPEPASLALLGGVLVLLARKLRGFAV